MPNPPPDRRTFLEALAGALGGFVRDYRANLDEPPPPPRQELAAVEAEVTAISAAVATLTQATDRNQQAVLDTLQRIADRMEQVDTRVAALEKAGQPEQAARWRALLKRLGELALLLVGPTALAAALRDAYVQDELYPALRDRLLRLLTRTETRVGPLQAATVSPAPAPTPPQPGTPTPAEIEAARSPAPGPGPLNFDWVAIPAGPFLMGSDPRADPAAEPDEQPQHTVHLSTFWISRTPVTNRQFAAFVQATNHRTTAEQQGWGWVWSGSQWQQINGAYWRLPHGPGSQIGPQRVQHPVTQVSWDDALAFCRWAHVRLPTEAEWEKAARGPDGRLYPWGNQPPNAQRCNFNRQVGDTTPVGSYPAGASPYGLLDMAGNVYEWCSDWYAEDAYQKQAALVAQNPSGPDSGQSRVLRGGAWYSAQYVRCAFRDGFYPGIRHDGDGFRVARSSP